MTQQLQSVIELAWEGRANLNPANLVVSGDYGGIENLIVRADKKPSQGGVLNYTNEKVNEMMWDRLQYERGAGYDQMVIMNVGLADFRRFFALQGKQQVRAGTRSNVLSAAKNI